LGNLAVRNPREVFFGQVSYRVRPVRGV